MNLRIELCYLSNQSKINVPNKMNFNYDLFAIIKHRNSIFSLLIPESATEFVGPSTK